MHSWTETERMTWHCLRVSVTAWPCNRWASSGQRQRLYRNEGAFRSIDSQHTFCYKHCKLVGRCVDVCDWATNHAFDMKSRGVEAVRQFAQGGYRVAWHGLHGKNKIKPLVFQGFWDIGSIWLCMLLGWYFNWFVHDLFMILGVKLVPTKI